MRGRYRPLVVQGFSSLLGLFQVILANLEMGIFEAKLLKKQGEIVFQSGMNLEGVTFVTCLTTCDFKRRLGYISSSRNSSVFRRLDSVPSDFGTCIASINKRESFHYDT